jgi:pyruvate/2-oxoglutarate dehydrogenase complex dihydrolipoamide acyltransferase (E2) component
MQRHDRSTCNLDLGRTAAGRFFEQFLNIMRYAIELPELGLEDKAARISGWHVDVDDVVVAGDVVAEVLLPGITFDVATVHSGKLVQIERPMDAVIATGDVLGWIETNDDNPSSFPDS